MPQEQEHQSATHGVYDSARMELVGRLSAGMAHDLNGPIGVMLGFVELAKDKLENAASEAESTAALEYLRLTAQSGENARSLARDMWEFARGKSEGVTEFPARRLVDRAVRLTGPTLRVANIHPGNPGSGTDDASVPEPTVRGDYALLTEALAELLVEAPGALPSGGEIGWKINAQSESREVEITLEAIPGERGAREEKEMGASGEKWAQWHHPERATRILSSQGGRLSSAESLPEGRTGVNMKLPSAVDAG